MQLGRVQLVVYVRVSSYASDQPVVHRETGNGGEKVELLRFDELKGKATKVLKYVHVELAGLEA